MKLPAVNEPQRYAGLYVVDFGDATEVGYTAQQVAEVFESEQHHAAQAYRIERVSPDGAFELRGVSRVQFTLESGMLFHRRDAAAAQADFEALCDYAAAEAPPCRAYVQLSQFDDHPPAGDYVVALVYPAEFEHDVSQWLLAANYAGGDTVTGGASTVTGYLECSKQILRRQQFHALAQSGDQADTSDARVG